MVYNPNEPRDNRGRWTAEDKHKAFVQEKESTNKIANSNEGEQLASILTFILGDEGVANVKKAIHKYVPDLSNEEVDEVFEQADDKFGATGLAPLKDLKRSTMTQKQFDTIDEVVKNLDGPVAQKAKSAWQKAQTNGAVKIVNPPN